MKSLYPAAQLARIIGIRTPFESEKRDEKD